MSARTVTCLAELKYFRFGSTSDFEVLPFWMSETILGRSWAVLGHLGASESVSEGSCGGLRSDLEGGGRGVGGGERQHDGLGYV